MSTTWKILLYLSLATFCLSSARGCDVDGDVQKHATVAGRMLPNISALASITDHL